MKNKTTWISLGIFLAVLLVGGYLLFQQQAAKAPTQAPTPFATQEEPTSEDGEMEQEGDVREVTVDGDEFSFAPSSLTVDAGETIRLTFRNTGNVPHNLTIDELGVATQTIDGGETDTVEFTVDNPGTYTFYCSVNGHRQLGMEGEVTAE